MPLIMSYDNFVHVMQSFQLCLLEKVLLHYNGSSVFVMLTELIHTLNIQDQSLLGHGKNVLGCAANQSNNFSYC